jgi:hypothetical protein
MRRALVRFGAILLPCVMLYPLSADFYVDWANYLWMIGYCGAYFRQHGAMPLVLNTPAVGGMPFPVFYGYLFFPVLGLVSAGIDAAIVVRLAAVGLFALQFVSVRRTLLSLGTDNTTATGIACLVIWAIYPLTNLYNRSALTEFFATGMLTYAVCKWFQLLNASKRLEMFDAALRFGLSFTFAAGTSPITALCSVPLLGILAVTLLTASSVPSRLQRLSFLLPAAVLSVLVLAPWAYATHIHRHRMQISADPNAWFAGLPADIDWWVTRLFPLPFDIRALRDAPNRVSTPYLDAQINIPLLLMLGFLTWRRLRGLPRPQLFHALPWLMVPLMYFACSLALSLSSQLFDHLPSLCKMVQFPYRLITYINLAILVAIFVLHHVVRCPAGTSKPLLPAAPVFLSCVLTLSAVGVIEKMVHASVARMPWDHNLVELPMSMYGFWSFAEPGMLAPLDTAAVPTQLGLFALEPDRAFGEYRPRTVHLDQAGYVLTQVQLFPWNHLYVDGRAVPPEMLRSWRGTCRRVDYGPCMAVPVPAGKHVIEYRLETNRRWIVLYRVSSTVLILWIALVMILKILALVQAARERRESVKESLCFPGSASSSAREDYLTSVA